LQLDKKAKILLLPFKKFFSVRKVRRDLLKFITK